MIVRAIEPDLHADLGGICRNRESPALAIGGTENHVHLLISLSKNVAVSDLMMALKKDSSKWIKLLRTLHEMQTRYGLCQSPIGVILRPVRVRAPRVRSKGLSPT